MFESENYQLLIVNGEMAPHCALRPVSDRAGHLFWSTDRFCAWFVRGDGR